MLVEETPLSFDGFREKLTRWDFLIERLAAFSSSTRVLVPGYVHAPAVYGVKFRIEFPQPNQNRELPLVRSLSFCCVVCHRLTTPAVLTSTPRFLVFGSGSDLE